MRNKIVAGNWKMNLDADEAESLYRDLLNKSLGQSDGKMTLIFPPNIYLKDFIEKNNGSFEIGAQNVNAQKNGAYTGEVSASQLKSIGCSWVLVGHSERRTLFNEDDKVLLDKINSALEYGLNVIYCCGESLNERKELRHKSKIQSQLAILKAFSLEQIKTISIAYEPIWAIGTGKTASPDQAAEMHDFIREELKILFGSEASDQTSILYGGSCSPSNAEVLFKCHNIDGGLIGGAALNADSFRSIIEFLK